MPPIERADIAVPQLSNAQDPRRQSLHDQRRPSRPPQTRHHVLPHCSLLSSHPTRTPVMYILKRACLQSRLLHVLLPGRDSNRACSYRRLFRRSLSRLSAPDKTLRLSSGTLLRVSKEKAHERNLVGPFETRQRPTFPLPRGSSSIGLGGLNFRVRDGNGWGPSGMATGNSHTE